jgi:hypothetical protein
MGHGRPREIMIMPGEKIPQLLDHAGGGREIVVELFRRQLDFGFDGVGHPITHSIMLPSASAPPFKLSTHIEESRLRAAKELDSAFVSRNGHKIKQSGTALLTFRL